MRLLDPHTGQLVREHLRAPRGWHRIEDRDRPARTPPKTLALLAAAKRAGPAVSTICDHNHRHAGAAGVRRILGVLALALARKHGPAVAEETATAALELGVPTYRFLRRYLDRRPAAPLSFAAADPRLGSLGCLRLGPRHQGPVPQRLPGRLIGLHGLFDCAQAVIDAWEIRTHVAEIRPLQSAADS